MIFLDVPGGVQFHVHVQPGARTRALAGPHGDAIKVRLAAPPIEGRANEALLAFLAEALGVRRQAVRLLRGHTARRKVIRVDDLSAEAAAALLLEG